MIQNNINFVDTKKIKKEFEKIISELDNEPDTIVSMFDFVSDKTNELHKNNQLLELKNITDYFSKLIIDSLIENPNIVFLYRYNHSLISLGEKLFETFFNKKENFEYVLKNINSPDFIKFRKIMFFETYFTKLISEFYLNLIKKINTSIENEKKEYEKIFINSSFFFNYVNNMKICDMETFKNYFVKIDIDFKEKIIFLNEYNSKERTLFLLNAIFHSDTKNELTFENYKIIFDFYKDLLMENQNYFFKIQKKDFFEFVKFLLDKYDMKKYFEKTELKKSDFSVKFFQSSYIESLESLKLKEKIFLIKEYPEIFSFLIKQLFLYKNFNNVIDSDLFEKIIEFYPDKKTNIFFELQSHASQYFINHLFLINDYFNKNIEKNEFLSNHFIASYQVFVDTKVGLGFDFSKFSKEEKAIFLYFLYIRGKEVLSIEEKNTVLNLIEESRLKINFNTNSQTKIKKLLENQKKEFSNLHNNFSRKKIIFK